MNLHKTLKLAALLVFVNLLTVSCTKKDNKAIIQNELIGYWQGVLHQVNGTPANEFSFMIRIDADGSHIYGRSEIRIGSRSEYFGIMDFEADFNKNKLSYKESNIRQEHTGSWYWCIKNAELTYDKAKKQLSGPWDAEGCNSGSIELYKMSVVSKTEFCQGEDIVIEAEGKELKWYSNDQLNNLLGTGNKFKPAVKVSSTYYVTQTIDGMESVPVPVSIVVNECN